MFYHSEFHYRALHTVSHFESAERRRPEHDVRAGGGGLAVNRYEVTVHSSGWVLSDVSQH
jgi:hypothetical protein